MFLQIIKWLTAIGPFLAFCHSYNFLKESIAKINKTDQILIACWVMMYNKTIKKMQDYWLSNAVQQNDQENARLLKGKTQAKYKMSIRNLEE